MPAKNASRQSRANVVISVARVTKLLRNGNPDKNLSDRAPVFVAGAIEQLVRGLLTNAAASANSHKSKRVKNTDIIKAVRFDPDFARVFGGFAFGSRAQANKAIDHILPEMMTDNKGHEVGQKSRREKQKKHKADKAEREAAKAARDEEVRGIIAEGDHEDLTA